MASLYLLSFCSGIEKACVVAKTRSSQRSLLRTPGKLSYKNSLPLPLRMHSPPPPHKHVSLIEWPIPVCYCLSRTGASTTGGLQKTSVEWAPILSCWKALYSPISQPTTANSCLPARVIQAGGRRKGRGVTLITAGSNWGFLR